MYKKLFKIVKGIIPKLSETELIALRSGTVSMDRDIFKGNIDLIDYKENYQEYKLDITDIDDILNKYGEENIYPNNRCSEIIDDLGKNNLFSLIIDKEYGGTKISTKEISSILTRLSSKNPSIGVSVMVPNSLGPGELLSIYGTDKQKNKYLYGLASGKLIPCFGLTGPHNGSDATGSIDNGIIKIKNGRRIIETKIDKRYITLAPIADLIGLAIDVKDPDGLIKEGSEGVTVALLERGHKGLKQETYHNPLNAGFPNGTLKGTVDIDIDQVIGGEKNIGNGWKMLMECLAAGRGISLPATANASSKVAMYSMYNYTRHRKQFRMPLIKMNAIQNKLADMLFDTWLIQTSIHLTNYILDKGEKPAVISAIMKQQTTERGRRVLENAMDIHAGGSICLGENNILEKFYRASPVGITVEGSNTLTRNLIIFGQGLNKSHPYIYPILDSVLNNNIKDFEKTAKSLVNHCISLYIKSFKSNHILKHQTILFANLSNFIAILGNQIKVNQSLSSDMADILSNIYLANSVLWYERNNLVSFQLMNYCIKRLCNENKVIFNRVIDNYPNNLRYLLLPFRYKIESYNYDDNKNIIEELLNNKIIMDKIRENIYEDDALKNLEMLNNLDINSKEYKSLYNKVISVGEYKID